jgi:hypothetical protein
MTRQLVHQMTVFSSDNVNQSGKEWRHEVAYLAMLELRAVMAVIDYQSDGVPAWEHPEFDEKVMVRLKKQLFLTNDNLKFAHHRNYSEYEENMRVPIRMALRLREVVIGQRKQLDKPFGWAEEAQLLGTIDKLMVGYYGYVIVLFYLFSSHVEKLFTHLVFPLRIRAFLTTPFPFPLVQMSRTFLFFYLFTTPFALLGDVSNPFAHYVVVFFLVRVRC